jgi:hypothetical protein
VADAKLQLWKEGTWFPSVAVGRTDLFGTGLFRSDYLVATKTFGVAGNLETSVGYGNGRLDGAFGGASWTPAAMPNVSLVAEYDANKYWTDKGASQTFAGERRNGTSLGAEYRWGWLGVQVARHRDYSSITTFVSISFSDREYVPKIYEPAYYNHKKHHMRPTIGEWQKDEAHRAALTRALVGQDYKNVRIQFEGDTLNLVLTSNRISHLGKTIGRAVRTTLAFSPSGSRSIRVTYTRFEQPIATYQFNDLGKLNDYLDQRFRWGDFLKTVAIRYANPQDRIVGDEPGMLAGVKDATSSS